RSRASAWAASTVARSWRSAVSSAISWAREEVSCTRSSASSRALASRRSICTTWARRATSACLASGPSCLRISLVRSVSRARFAAVASSLRSALSLRLRCLRIPAASSMKPRRSSAVADSTESSRPCPTITCISRPIPESDSRSWMSSNRQEVPLIAYSEPPPEDRVREMVTSAYSIGRAPSVLSMVRETSARPSGGREEVPAKITSAIAPPRSDLAPCSPITQASASTTLDLPDPFGPTTQVMPGSRLSVVADANDLKPRSVSVFRCTVPRLAARWRPDADLDGLPGPPQPANRSTQTLHRQTIDSRPDTWSAGTGDNCTVRPVAPRPRPDPRALPRRAVRRARHGRQHRGAVGGGRPGGGDRPRLHGSVPVVRLVRRGQTPVRGPPGAGDPGVPPRAGSGHLAGGARPAPAARRRGAGAGGDRARRLRRGGGRGPGAGDRHWPGADPRGAG